jgi:rubrerythrin
VHAHNHLRTLGGIGDTRQNLQEAIAGETHEFKNMYPQMIADAELEGSTEARRSFTFANAVEKVHANLYQRALDTLGAAGEEFDYYICPVCGHTVERGAPERCEVCGAQGALFYKVS